MRTDDRDMAGIRGVEGWHEVVAQRDPALLADLLADDVVFNSPIVFTPQRGKALTTMYLAGAMHVIANDTFTYVREVVAGSDAVLEFATTIDDIEVNGVDMIHFDDEGRIVDFTVMLRPFKGIMVVKEHMGTLLAEVTGASSD